MNSAYVYHGGLRVPTHPTLSAAIELQFPTFPTSEAPSDIWCRLGIVRGQN